MGTTVAWLERKVANPQKATAAYMPSATAAPRPISDPYPCIERLLDGDDFVLERVKVPHRQKLAIAREGLTLSPPNELVRPEHRHDHLGARRLMGGDELWLRVVVDVPDPAVG